MCENKGWISGRKAFRMVAVLLAVLLATVGLACAAAEGDLTAVYAAYAEVLRGQEARIRQYWQGGGALTDDGYVGTVEPRAIVLADVMGDDVPELIFIARGGDYDATLFIYTCENGVAKQLLSHGNWDTYGGSSGVNCLYQIAGTKDLCGAVAGNYNGFYHWYSEDGATLREESLIRMYDGDDPMSFLNGQEVENALYDSRIGGFPRVPEKLLIYTIYKEPSGAPDWDSRELIEAAGMESVAMTYDEAMALLGGTASAPAEPMVEPAATDAGSIASGLPAEALEQNLIHFFDAQDSQSVTFHSDGSFDFQSAGISGTGDGGSGTYSGQIDRVTQTGAHTYELHIAGTQIVGTETFGNYGSWDDQPFYADETIVLVLPGADESELNGYIEPTIEQLEMYGDAIYESAYFYIGSLDSNGMMRYLPYENYTY